MRKKKFGIWKTRYACNSRKYAEGWVKKENHPIFFYDKHSAENFAEELEKRNYDMQTKYEVRCSI